jgi:hypothetical protein
MSRHGSLTISVDGPAAYCGIVARQKAATVRVIPLPPGFAHLHLESAAFFLMISAPIPYDEGHTPIGISQGGPNAL